MPVTVSKPAFNLREALNSLRRKMGLKGSEILRAETVDDVYNVIGRNKNLLINGDFRVSQRGTFTSSAPVNVEYRLDRWKNIFVSGVHTFVHNLDQSITADSGGGLRSHSANTLRFDTTTLGAFACSQQVEDFKLARGKDVTLSLLYKCNADSAINIYDGFTQTHYKLPNTNGAWAWISSRPFRVSASATELRVELYTYPNVPQAGSYIEITQVQLELGSVATPFEYRPFANELALCQRYYQTSLRHPNGSLRTRKVGWVGRGTGNYKLYGQTVFPVEMRATPTVTLHAYGTDSGVNEVGDGRSGLTYYQTNSAFPQYATTTYGIWAAAESRGIVAINLGDNSSYSDTIHYEAGYTATAEL